MIQVTTTRPLTNGIAVTAPAWAVFQSGSTGLPVPSACPLWIAFSLSARLPGFSGPPAGAVVAPVGADSEGAGLAGADFLQPPTDNSTNRAAMKPALWNARG